MDEILSLHIMESKSSGYELNDQPMENMKDPSQRWRAQKAKLLLRFSHLVEGDVRYDYGMKEVMMTRLQEKLGKSREELDSLLRTL